MNTIGKIGIALAVLMVFSLAAPATATYAGDKPLVTYENQVIHGGIVFETVTDGTAYTVLPSDGSVTQTQSITITIPDGATVKTARLYNYYSWSKSNFGDKYVSGDPAEATLTFNGATVTCLNPSTIPNLIDYGNGTIQYWDTKGWYPGCLYKYDYPSGTFAWDVTDLVTGSGTYTATITNADSSPTLNEYFATWGFGLLVVYEGKEGLPKIEYWIDEGCDILYNTSKYGVYEPIATTSAPFDGVVNWGVGKVHKEATLTAVVMAPDKGYMSDWDASKNMMYFNDEEIGPCVIDESITGVKPTYWRTKTIGSSNLAGMIPYDVTPYLIQKDNVVYFQDRDLGTGKGDNIAVSNAFLVVEKISPRP